MKRGPLNLGMRMEWLMARLSMQVSKATGNNPKWKDIIRFHDPIEEAEQLTDKDIPVEAFAAMFGAKLKKKE